MLRHIKADEEEKSVLRKEGERKGTEIQQKTEQISSIREEAQAIEQQKAKEIDQLKVIDSSEVEQLKLRVRDLKCQNQAIIGKHEAEVTELKAKTVICEDLVKNIDKTLQIEREQFEIQLAKEREQFETQIAKEREQFETLIAKEREESERQLTKEREVSGTLKTENHDLRSEVSISRTNINSLQHTNSTLEADISRKDATIKRKESELKMSTRLLQEKDAIISGMSEQLTRARECLATKQQVSSVCVFNMYTWIAHVAMRTSFICLITYIACMVLTLMAYPVGVCLPCWTTIHLNTVALSEPHYITTLQY